jgi:hypothetical protein
MKTHHQGVKVSRMPEVTAIVAHRQSPSERRKMTTQLRVIETPRASTRERRPPKYLDLEEEEERQHTSRSYVNKRTGAPIHQLMLKSPGRRKRIADEGPLVAAKKSRIPTVDDILSLLAQLKKKSASLIPAQERHASAPECTDKHARMMNNGYHHRNTMLQSDSVHRPVISLGMHYNPLASASKSSNKHARMHSGYRYSTGTKHRNAMSLSDPVHHPALPLGMNYEPLASASNSSGRHASMNGGYQGLTVTNRMLWQDN